jgi:hypothetical protein
MLVAGGGGHVLTILLYFDCTALHAFGGCWRLEKLEEKAAIKGVCVDELSLYLFPC